MDMPGVVFVLGRDPERWLVELNQPAHKLNFQHAFFEGSFNLMAGLLFINLLLFSDQFRGQNFLTKNVEHKFRKLRHN